MNGMLAAFGETITGSLASQNVCFIFPCLSSRDIIVLGRGGKDKACRLERPGSCRTFGTYFAENAAICGS